VYHAGTGPRDEPDTSEERQLHDEDGGRDDALVDIQDVMRQMAARVDALADSGARARGRARPRPTPPRGRMPAYSADDARSDAGRSDDGRSSASTMDPLDGVAGGPVGPPDPLLAHYPVLNGLDAQQHYTLLKNLGSLSLGQDGAQMTMDHSSINVTVTGEFASNRIFRHGHAGEIVFTGINVGTIEAQAEERQNHGGFRGSRQTPDHIEKQLQT
jgi:hypothetical protein